MFRSGKVARPADFTILLQSSILLWSFNRSHTTLAVDSFFFMSGMLLVFTAKELHPLKAIAKRYLR